ncbi:hypothetical protein [Syntrophus aciditrophicus]|uniref:Hypothetical exported protein n=1 Tax=Syntrophus aciditrophicus (strain SB) TaxID=56780 RepID=Q2LV16_SYNAS|nr:hypothetical protein [Syntrophus aciditrophicus]ABC77927.1 hypothetical exported protein [Syntrophus aciditrophicus SB]
MKRISLLILLVGLLFCAACATTPSVPERTTTESMLNFLPYLNQKVAGYLDMNPAVVLDAKTYKKIVDEECGPLPSCGKNADVMYDTYSVQPRWLDGIFSVMLCDKNGAIKIMEDFSCNEQLVEIASFQNNPSGPCIFEDKWKEKVAPSCPEIK